MTKRTTIVVIGALRVKNGSKQFLKEFPPVKVYPFPLNVEDLLLTIISGCHLLDLIIII